MDSGYYYIMMSTQCAWFGMSIDHDACYDERINQLPEDLNPHGAALNNTLQQVSGAIGSAVLLTLMTKRMETVGATLFAEAQAIW